MNALTLPLAGLIKFQHARTPLVLGASLLLLFGVFPSAMQSVSISKAAAAAATPARLPSVAPLLVRDVAPEQAVQLNAAIPLSSEPNPSAPAFALPNAGETDRARAVECLTGAVYYEAGSESIDGQRAVAQVVLNRVRHPAFPATVCGVLYQGSTRATGCQFSFTCDGSLARRPDQAGWARAREVAEAALSGQVFAPVGLATHYHANYVAPYWAPTLTKNAVIGAHVFYRWPGRWGQPSAFANRYAGGEQDIVQLRRAALEAEDATRVSRPDARQGSSLAEQRAAVDLQIAMANSQLGPRHPDMIALKQKSVALAQAPRPTIAAQLAAIDSQLNTARKTLGPKHPRMVALLEQRSALAPSAR